MVVVWQDTMLIVNTEHDKHTYQWEVNFQYVVEENPLKKHVVTN